MTKADLDPARRNARAVRARRTATKSRKTIDAATAAAGSSSRGDPAALYPAAVEKLARLGIKRAVDLVLHLPSRYDDETRVAAIAAAPSGRDVLVEGRVVDAEVKYRPRRQLVCHIEDGTGVLTLRFLNFYPSQVKQLAPGSRVRVFGEIRHGFFGAEMVHPRCKAVQADAPLPEALTPVYPTTAGLGQETLRRMIGRALADCDLSESIPEEIANALALPGFREAVRFLHSPPPEVAQADLVEREHPAWRRIKFDELLAQQLSMRMHYNRRKAANAPALPPRKELTRRLVESLPFALTMAQRRAFGQVARDLARRYPMQRLLQGDVGSGKTIIAALAALQGVENGGQVAVMAPTEILAEQHYRKFSAWLQPLGVEVTWIAGALSRKEKDRALAALGTGSTQIGIGTHALFQEEVRFANLVLAIIDEQHRFGVHQRLALRMKGTPSEGVQPHQLMMSATPIPRTLAMSYYADLDVSLIDELPPGRTPIATKLVSDARRDEVVRRVRDACMSGSQAYWVCPLIEESENLQLKTALDTFAALKAAFPELEVALLHGRLKADEKTAVMDAFQRGAVQLLVATTVIEVGVDVPNASLMVIEHAERMGLSQLHQLRGRVGRGAAASACILLYQAPLSATARERLKIIYENSDGFEIARHDLRLRGPGEMMGARQSGVPMLRFADLNEDGAILDAARDATERLLRDHPEAARRHLSRWLGGKSELLKV